MKSRLRMKRQIEMIVGYDLVEEEEEDKEHQIQLPFTCGETAVDRRMAGDGGVVVLWLELPRQQRIAFSVRSFNGDTSVCSFFFVTLSL